MNTFTRQLNTADYAALISMTNRVNKRIDRVNKAHTLFDNVALVHNSAEAVMGIDGKREVIHTVTVTVPTTEAICRPGYALLAIITNADETSLKDGDKNRLVSRVNSTDVNLSWTRTCKPTCYECGRAVHRKRLFAVATPSGMVELFGGKCVEAFIPKGNTSYLNILEEVCAFENLPAGFGGNDPWHYSVKDVLQVTAQWLTIAPFVRSGEDNSTRDCVQHVLDFGGMCKSTNCYICQEWPKHGLTEEAAAKIADDASGYATSDSFGNSDYAGNLRAVINCGIVTPRKMGLAVSAVSVWNREVERKIMEQAEVNGGYIDENVGDKISVDATLVSVRDGGGIYGGSIVKLLTANGKVLCWFASRTPSFPIGAKVHVLATVKRKDEFRGQPSNLITRAKLTTAAPETVKPAKPAAVKVPAASVTDLPEGWTLTVKVTPKGRAVKTWRSPEGKAFRSLKTAQAAWEA